MKLDTKTGTLEGTPEEMIKFLNTQKVKVIAEKKVKPSASCKARSPLPSSQPKKKGRPLGCKDKIKRKPKSDKVVVENFSIKRPLEFGATSVRYNPR